MLCGAPAGRPFLEKGPLQIFRCGRCELGYQPRFVANPVEYYLNADYYSAWWQSRDRDERGVLRVKEKTSGWVLDQIEKRFPRAAGASLLEIGCAFGYFLRSAQKRGYDAQGIEISEAGEEARRLGHRVFNETLESYEPGRTFDVVVLIDVFEHFADPESALEKIRRLLKPGGVLAMIIPDFGSTACRLLGPAWLHYKLEHLFYYTKKSLRSLLEKHGFDALELKTAKKGTSLAYVAAHSAKYGNFPKFANAALRALPFSSHPVLVRSELFCLARPRA